MSAIKDYIQSLNGEGLLSNLWAGDGSGAASDPAGVQGNEAPVMTEMAVQETGIQAANDQGGATPYQKPRKARRRLPAHRRRSWQSTPGYRRSMGWPW